MEWTQEKLVEANRLIMEGNGSIVKKWLCETNSSKVSHNFAVELSKLSNRVEDYDFSIRILFPKVRGELASPTSQEIVQYAYTLLKKGCLTEAKHLMLNESGACTDDFTLEYLELYFRTWDYFGGIKLLENCLTSGSDQYRNLVLKVNLIAALIEVGNYSRASRMIEEAVTEAKRLSAKMLEANLNELKGQVLFFTGDYDRALSCFKSSSEALKITGNRSYLFARKWLLLCEMKQNRSFTDLSSKMAEVRKLAVKTRHWETIRDLDLHSSRYYGDENLFRKVYYGTPFPSFRVRAMRVWDDSDVLIPEIEIGQKLGSVQKLDLKELLQNESFAPRICRLALKSLLHDLYSPKSVYELFSDIYEGEFFNPNSTKLKVYKALEGLRSALKRAKLPLELTSNRDYGYRIRTLTRVRMFYPENLKQLSVDPKSMQLSDVRDRLSDGFTRDEFAQVYGLQKRTALRRLNSLIKSGKLAKKGIGKSIQYFWVENKRAA